MDTDAFSIQPAELSKRFASAHPPLVLDVRRQAAFDASPHILAGAVRCLPENVAAYAQREPVREVIVYCVYGHQVSQDAAAELRSNGWNARYLRGGLRGGEDGVDSPADIALWRATQLPMQAKSAS
jgi:rhodanese-related sulfurtransferase